MIPPPNGELGIQRPLWYDPVTGTVTSGSPDAKSCDSNLMNWTNNFIDKSLDFIAVTQPGFFYHNFNSNYSNFVDQRVQQILNQN